MCVTLQQWMVVANARYGIVQGGAIAVVGGFLDATIAGLPAGAVLNAIGVSMGITGTAVVTDHTSWVDSAAASRCSERGLP